MFLILGTSPVFTIVMLVSLCKVGGEMELLLELCNHMPSTCPLFILNQIITLDIKLLWEILIVMSLLSTFAWSNPTIVTTPKLVDFSIINPIWGMPALGRLLKLLTTCWSWIVCKSKVNFSSLELGIILTTPILIELVSWTACFDTKKKEEAKCSLSSYKFNCINIP